MIKEREAICRGCGIRFTVKRGAAGLYHSRACYTDPNRRKRPSWWRCGKCEHKWIVIYLPMEMALAARILKQARCPMCGQNAKRLFMTEPPVKRRRASSAR